MTTVKQGQRGVEEGLTPKRSERMQRHLGQGGRQDMDNENGEGGPEWKVGRREPIRKETLYEIDGSHMVTEG